MFRAAATLIIVIRSIPNSSVDLRIVCLYRVLPEILPVDYVLDYQDSIALKGVGCDHRWPGRPARAPASPQLRVDTGRLSVFCHGVQLIDEVSLETVVGVIMILWIGYIELDSN